MWTNLHACLRNLGTNLLVIFIVFVHIACATEIPKLLLISMDGFRYNYLDKLPASETPNFHKMIKNGVKAKWMTSVFPTVTYPNHFTLITGLYPESHGIVHNRFYDRKWEEHFWYDNKRDNYDPIWYDVGAEPIYVTNHFAGRGRKSGSLLWPTGVGKVKCVGPDYTIPDATAFTQMNFTDRVDRVIDWFTRDIDPINLGLLYFNEPDEYGHHYGPESEEIKTMIKELDTVLGYLFKRLEEAKLNDSVNIILTADHGFAEVKEFRKLSDYIDPDSYTSGSDFKNTITVQIFPKEGMQQAIVANLSRMQNVSVLEKNKSPKLQELHYNDHERIAPIILTGEEGVVIVKDENHQKNFTAKGMHGYLPDIPDMHPFFIAMGPAFKKGHLFGEFKNVDVYPLMCYILGIAPAPNNGSLDTVIGMLREDEEEKERTFTLTAVSFLLLVGLSVMVAGIFAICACRNARNKTRFLTPWKKRIRTETGFKFLSNTETGLLSLNDDDDEF